jgi:hypothetical protein
MPCFCIVATAHACAVKAVRTDTCDTAQIPLTQAAAAAAAASTAACAGSKPGKAAI